MRVIDLALKDLLQIVRDKKSALFLVAMPIVFTLFLGFVLTGAVGDTRLPVGWIDNDGGTLSASLKDLVNTSNAVRPVSVDPAEADAQVREEKLAAVAVVPAGFSEHMLAGEIVPLDVPTLPSSQAGQTARTALQVASQRIAGAAETARLSTEASEAKQPFPGAAARRAYTEQAFARASEAWKNPSFTVESYTPAGLDTRVTGMNGFLQSSPGMVVQFAVFALVTCATVLVLERKSKTLQRLMTTPITRVEVIGGHLLAMFLVVLLQELMLVLVGQLAFGVNYLGNPLGTLLVMVSLALWVSSLGLLIGAISRGEEQVVMFSLIAMFVFSALGGAWFPLEITGSTFSTIGHFTPGAWAMEGFQNIVLRGFGLATVLVPAGAGIVFAAIFFALAVWRFRTN